MENSIVEKWHVNDKIFNTQKSAQYYIDNKMEEDILREKVSEIKKDISRMLSIYINPVFIGNKSSDSMEDDIIEKTITYLRRFIRSREDLLIHLDIKKEKHTKYFEKRYIRRHISELSGKELINTCNDLGIHPKRMNEIIENKNATEKEIKKLKNLNIDTSYTTI